MRHMHFAATTTGRRQVSALAFVLAASAAFILSSGDAPAVMRGSQAGGISASACMGDSGGPVAKFDGKRYVLVGIVERVSNYAGIGACGFLTHFSSVSGVSNVASVSEGTSRQVSEPRRTRVAGKGKRRHWASAH